MEQSMLHVVSAINNENHQRGFVFEYGKPFNLLFFISLNESGNDFLITFPSTVRCLKEEKLYRKFQFSKLVKEQQAQAR
jgi:hypothetical protein